MYPLGSPPSSQPAGHAPVVGSQAAPSWQWHWYTQSGANPNWQPPDGDDNAWNIYLFKIFIKHAPQRTKNCQFPNFVVAGGIVSCHYDNLRCHRSRQSCQIDDLLFLFSVHWVSWCFVFGSFILSNFSELMLFIYPHSSGLLRLQPGNWIQINRYPHFTKRSSLQWFYTLLFWSTACTEWIKPTGHLYTGGRPPDKQTVKKAVKNLTLSILWFIVCTTMFCWLSNPFP